MSDSRGWIDCAIGEISTLSGGSAFKEEFQGHTAGEIPFIKVSDFSLPENLKYITRANNWVSTETIKDMGARVFPPGSVVFPKVGAALLSNRRRILSRPTALDNNLMAAIPKGCHPEFLYLALCQIDFSRFFQGGAVPSVNQEQVASVELSLPPLPEQKKIAEILSGIDKVIDLTKRKLASERDLRAALLNEMIAENRPFFKLEMVATRVSGHTPSKSNSEYWNGGIPWVSLSDMAKLDKRFICDTSKKISEQGIRNSSAVLHPAGLVILSRDARVGCSAITAKKMAVSQHFIGWICSERLLNTYLYYVLQKWKKKFEAIAMGSTIATIGVPFFRDLEIPIPPINEQQKVANALESIDDSIDILEGRIVRLESLKNALASGLLSGRKCVTL
jgi:type I restriction enzyme S subunit